jgi:ankyrin repeat protein
LKIEFKFICNLGFISRSYIQNKYEFDSFPYSVTGKKSTNNLDLIMANSFTQFRRLSSKDNFILKKTTLKYKDKNEVKMNKSVINMLSIQDNILKSLYYYKDSIKTNNGSKNKNNLKEKSKKFDREQNKKAISFHTSSSKLLLSELRKKNSMKLSRINLNNILNNRKMIKRSSTLMKDKILKIKNSQINEININHYSILQQKHFFKKRKLSSNDNKNESIFFINEKDNSREDNLDTYKIYIELIKLIFEGKNNLFINLYKKNKEYIDVNQDLFEGNTLLIMSAKDGNVFISKFLCEQGAKINTQNQKGNTALHYAIGKQFYGVADVLTRYGAKEDIRNNMGLTPWECIEHNIED